MERDNYRQQLSSATASRSRQLTGSYLGPKEIRVISDAARFVPTPQFHKHKLNVTPPATRDFTRMINAATNRILVFVGLPCERERKRTNDILLVLQLVSWGWRLRHKQPEVQQRKGLSRLNFV